MADITLRINDRKKYSQKTNDYRIKSLLDFFSRGDVLSDCPEFFLVAKLLGTLPKRTDPRPVWSSIATVVMVFSHSDKALKQGRLFDDYLSPSVAQIRTLLAKHKAGKAITLKRAFKIISVMTIGHQPHWICSPLYASCVENNCPMFWTAPSISRLLHFVINYAQSATLETPASAAHGSSGLDAPSSSMSKYRNSSPTHHTGASHADHRSNSPHGDLGGASLQSPVAGDSSPKSPSSIQGARSVASNNSEGKAIATAVPVAVQSVLNLSKSAKLKQLAALAKEFWSAEVKQKDVVGRLPSPTAQAPRSPSGSDTGNMTAFVTATADFKTVSFDTQDNFESTSLPLKFKSPSRTSSPSSSQRLSLIEPSLNIHRRPTSSRSSSPNMHQLDVSGFGNTSSGPALGLIRFNTISKIDTESASEYIDPSLTITAAELALILIEAWEEELQFVKFGLERARVSKLRRPAICGTFNFEEIKMNAEYRLAVERIIDWYAAQGYRGVDWDDVKERGASRAFPFHVPEGLLNKSSAELNYAMETINSLRIDRRAKETLEDLLTLSGPYGHITKAMYPRGKAASMKEEVLMTREEREALIREKYLAGQTLGHHNLVGLTEENPRKHLDPFSHASYHPPPADSRVASARIHAKGYEFSEELGVSGSFHGSDNRLKSPTVKKTPTVNGLLKGAEDVLDEWRPVNIAAQIQSIDVYPVVITRPEISHDSDRIESLREPVIAPTNFMMPQLPGIEEGDFYSTNEDDARICAQLALEGLRNKVSTNDAAKSRIRARLDKAISAMNKTIRDNDGVTVADPYDLSYFMEKEKEKEVEVGSKTPSKVRFGSEGGGAPNSRVPAVREDAESANKRHGFASTVDLNKMLEASSQKSTAAVRAEDTAANAIALRGLNISNQSLQHLAERFLKPWQVKKLLKIDFSDSKLDRGAVSILSSRLGSSCILVHLNLTGCHLGEVGCKMMIDAVVAGGGHNTMLRLDLQQNNITLSTDALVGLKQFTRLRALDLSLNYITMDVVRQQDMISAILLHLRELQSLSLAFNRIQNVGFIIMYEIVHNYLVSMKVLDLANCFITNKSLEIITCLLQLTRPKLQTVMLQGNLLLSGAVESLRQLAKERSVALFLQDDAYVGIVEPLCYDVGLDCVVPLDEDVPGPEPDADSSIASRERRVAKFTVPNQQHKRKPS